MITAIWIYLAVVVLHGAYRAIIDVENERCIKAIVHASALTEQNMRFLFNDAIAKSVTIVQSDKFLSAVQLQHDRSAGKHIEYIVRNQAREIGQALAEKKLLKMEWEDRQDMDARRLRVKAMIVNPGSPLIEYMEAVRHQVQTEVRDNQPA